MNALAWKVSTKYKTSTSGQTFEILVYYICYNVTIKYGWEITKMYTTQLTTELTTNISHKVPYSESPSCLIYLLVYCLLVIEQYCYQQHPDKSVMLSNFEPCYM
jgi:hypothetical protein